MNFALELPDRRALLGMSDYAFLWELADLYSAQIYKSTSSRGFTHAMNFKV